MPHSSQEALAWMELLEKGPLTDMQRHMLAKWLRRVADQLKEDELIREGFLRWLGLENT